MRSSDNKNGFTMVDHLTFDVIIPQLSTTAQSVFMRIYRQTLGWKKPRDSISNSQFRKWCKIKNHETIKTAVEELEELGLVTVTGNATQIKEYGISYETMERYRTAHLDGRLDDIENLSTELSTWLATGRTA